MALGESASFAVPRVVTSTLAGATGFWGWWQRHGAALVDDALEQQSADVLAPEITERLAAVHPNLEWHLVAGTESRHRLIISSGGIAEYRSLAERVIRLAPAADATWSYGAARPAEPDWATSAIQLPGLATPVLLGDARAVWSLDEQTERVDVVLTHPQFAQMPDDVRLPVLFHALDALLGEDLVADALGSLGVENELGGARPLDELAAAVHEARQPAPDRGVQLLGFSHRGTPMMWTRFLATRQGQRPLLDLRMTIEVHYAKRSDGYPKLPLDELPDIEGALAERLGDRALLLGITTGRGVRAYHAMVDVTDRAAVDGIRDLVAADRGLRLGGGYDPEWSAARTPLP